MRNEIFQYGKWICNRQMRRVDPIDLFHKQLDKREIELPEEFQNMHMLVKKEIQIQKKAASYRMRLTADDYYKLYINGKYVCQGPSQGYFFCYYWNEVDITEFLVDGINEIFVDVYYQGLINRAYNSGDRRMGMIGELFEDDTCLCATDETWNYVMSGAYTTEGTIGYKTMFAEHFDSRWKPERWEAAEVKEVDYIFHIEPTKVLQVYEKEPITITPLAEKGVLYDFGEEITAGLRIKAKGEKGLKIRILCGEELEDSAVKVRFHMRCSCHCEEFWTLDEGENELEQYDYRAFRYVAVIPEDGAAVEDVTAVVRHYPFDDDYCTLETESEVLQAVWQICKNGVKYGAQETYVDCPLREKGQYAGDLTITSASHVVLTGDTSLFRKAIDNQIQSAFVCKGLLAVTPGSLMQEVADYSLQFPILALRYYRYTKDTAYLRKCLNVCNGIIEHFQQFAAADGLLEDVGDKWNLVDWPQNLRDDYDFPLESVMPKGLGAHNVLNAFYIGCVKQTEEICDILGVAYEKKSEKLIQAFHDAFYHSKTGLYVDSRTSEHSSLHANALVAYYGICRKEEEGKIRAFILEKGLCCGVYMAYFVLKALCRMGYYEDAYQFIISEGEHSWYNMVQEGATTCFEAWGKEQKWNTSLCHPWASGPISVLAEDILPNKPEVGRLVYKSKIE